MSEISSVPNIRTKTTIKGASDLALSRRFELALGAIFGVMGISKVLPSVFAIGWANQSLLPAWALIFIGVCEAWLAVALLYGRGRPVTSIAVLLCLFVGFVASLTSIFRQVECGCAGPVTLPIWLRFCILSTIGLLWFKSRTLPYESKALDLLRRTASFRAALTLLLIGGLFSFFLGTIPGRRLSGLMVEVVQVAGVATLDMGSGIEGQVISAVATVCNNSRSDIQVIGQRASCGCVNAGPFPIRIGANSSRELPITVDLSRKEEGPFEHYVILYLDSELQRELSLAVNGSVIDKS